MTHTQKKRPKKRRWLRWTGGIVLSLIVIMGGILLYHWKKLDNVVEKMHEPLARDSDPKRQKELNDLFKNKSSINILLLGIDARDDTNGRSDTMILMSVNPKTDSTLMVSIPRDTYVEIPERGFDKINHAYAFGKTDLAISTVENTFDVPIHFYVRVNMDGFEQGVDTIGGVTVVNDFEFSQGGKKFPKGSITLTGEEALEFTRMRKNDPNGDFGRNERQRNVVSAAMEQGAKFSNVTKISNLLDITGDNVKTNMDQKHLESLFKNYRNTFKSNKSVEIDGTGEMMDKIWYYKVSDNEIQRIHNLIIDHMEAK